MQVRMLRTVPGAANPSGSRVRTYAAGEVVAASAPWQRELAAVFLREGWAENMALGPAPENKAAEPAAADAAPARGRKRKG